MRQSFDEHTDPSFGRQHLPLIRKAMAEQGLDGFLIPHEDEHQNEYLPEANDRLAWATGFTGSAGAAVVLKEKAAIFVDGRYTLQVRDQVDQDLFEIKDLVDGGVPAYRNQSVAPEGPSSFRIVDEFSTAQISAGHTSYILRQVDPDHIELVMEAGAMKFQRCK